LGFIGVSVLRWPAYVFACLLLLCAARDVRAQDSRAGLMSQPIGYTDVADAFETDDPIDVNVHLAYLHDATSGTVQREVVDASSKDGRSSAHWTDVAEHHLIENQLALQVDVGVYHDVMVFARMPIVLGEDNELRPPAQGCQVSPAAAGCQALLEPTPGEDAPTQPLFALDTPFHSPRRSGLRSFDFGAAWAVTNQYRVKYLPTWVLRIALSTSTGRAMHACAEGEHCNPGIGRGTASITFESRWSYRYGALEPFFGVAYTYQWVSAGQGVFYPQGKLPGIVDPGPPSLLDTTVGSAVIPWEDRSRYQRFEIDLLGQATLISASRDYTPLFDALGSSDNPHLTAPNYEQVTGSGPHQPITFTGITNVQSYARLGVSTALVMQAARYVRFALGLGVSTLTSHLITGAPACNRSVSASDDDARKGPCAEGIANPVYRPAIDAPGRRFRLDGALTLGLSAMATGQF
jgi:hypothetical protein